MVKLRVPEWCCAVRFIDGKGDVLSGNNAPFTVLKDNYRYWTADPFLFEKDGKYYLFFEAFDRLKRKGALGVREISRNSAGKIKIIYETDFHMSYPFVFENNGEVYIIPEAFDSGELFALKCVDFPYKWEKCKTISSTPLADTTPFEYNGRLYYLSERIITKGVFDRLDLFYDDNGEFKECENNPVKLDASTARCAGKLFEKDGEIFRPSQDCSEDYGKKLNFNKLISLDKDGYNEKTVCTLNCVDIRHNHNGSFCGIHTYNRLKNVETVDLKIPSVFNLFNIIGAVIKRLFR